MSGPAILQVIPSLGAGGAERSTIDIARALKRRGFTALVASEGGRMEPELHDAGGELIRMPAAAKDPFTIYSNGRAFADLVQDRNVLFIHARSRAPAWSSLLAARRTKIPMVTTHHGIYSNKGLLKRFYNSVMVRGDAVIANSEWTANHIRESYGRKVKRLAIIPRGLDLNYYDPSRIEPHRVATLRRQWQVADHQRVILLPGRYTRWKGQPVFIEALGILKQNGVLAGGIRAVIAGDAQGRQNYLEEMLAAITVHRLDNIVVLAGHVTDMAAAYAASDIVVSASTDPEAFGRVAPEAAAMCRPVVATDHGGARETVLVGESGFLTQPGDANALADALADLLNSPPERLAAMGAKGRAHISAHYSVDRMCNDTLDLYGRLIEERSRRR